MMWRQSWTVCSLLVLIMQGSVEPAVAEDRTERFQEVAQRLVQAINTGDHLAIRQDFTQAMLEQ